MEIIQLVGGEATESWSQVRVVTPLSEEESAQTGSLLMVINLKGKNELAEKGLEIVEEIVSRFQKEGGFPRPEWIKRTRDFLVEKLEGRGSTVLAVVWKNPEMKKTVYITGVGEGAQLRLERKGRESKLWPAEGNWLSGRLNDDDKLILGTSKFWGEMWTVTENLGERIELVREKMVADLSGEAAAVIAEFNEEEPAPVIESGVWPRPERETVELKPIDSKRRTWLFRIGGVFLVLLLVSVGAGMWRRDKLNKQNHYQVVAQPIRDALTEAEQIRGVNPIRARDLMTKAKQTIESTTEFEVGEFATDWKSLVVKVDQQWQVVSGEKQIESKNWFDLAVIKEGMTVDLMTVDGSWLEVLDKNNKLVGGVNLNDKTSQQLMAGSSLDGVVGMGKGVLLTDKGLIKINPDKKTTTNIFAQMDELESANKVTGFGGNVYTMDATDLWKFPATDAGLGNRRRYFGVGVTPSLSEIVDMWVDGDVWLMTSSGTVSRYTKGAKVSFNLSGWSDGFGGAQRLITSESELFIWDKQNGVVVVFDRETGDYKRKLSNDNLKMASDLVVDETGQRLIMAVGGKLMEMSYN